MRVVRSLCRISLIVAFLFELECGTSVLRAQETVLNVPSADVLDKGKSYMEWDATVGDQAPSAAITPRSVWGVGHGIETGVNLTTFNFPGSSSLTIVPTIKCKMYQQKRLQLDFFAGEHVFLPLTRRTYNAGSLSYVASARTWKSGTRLAAGVYDFSAHVVDRANRGGIFASIEQPVNARVSIATDWFSGDTQVGYVTSGAAIKVTRSVTVVGAFQMGNYDLLDGNHSVLFELGWNPQKSFLSF